MTLGTHRFRPDIFYAPLLSNLFNYADDNSAYYCHNDVNVIKNKFECDAKLMINSFNDNGMKANASKFQYLTVFSNNISPNEYQNLGLLFFINWFTDFFIENLGTEDEIKIKIQYNTST